MEKRYRIYRGAGRETILSEEQFAQWIAGQLAGLQAAIELEDQRIGVQDELSKQHGRSR